MLPLRSLIITIDPASRTSPLDILNRWRKELEIIVWEEEEFLPEIDSAHSGVILRGACKPDEHEDGVSSVANGCALFSGFLNFNSHMALPLDRLSLALP